MRVLITGGSGLIGRAGAAPLAGSGREGGGLSRAPRPVPELPARGPAVAWGGGFPGRGVGGLGSLHGGGRGARCAPGRAAHRRRARPRRRGAGEDAADLPPRPRRAAGRRRPVAPVDPRGRRGGGHPLSAGELGGERSLQPVRAPAGHQPRLRPRPRTPAPSPQLPRPPRASPSLAGRPAVRAPPAKPTPRPTPPSRRGLRPP